MNLKPSITCLSALVMAAQLSMPLAVFAVGATALPGLTQGGGQAPPTPSGETGTFTVIVATKLPKATADNLRDELVKEAFPAAESRAAADGAYEVAIGGLSSRGDAEALIAKLRTSGYTPDGIVESGASSSTTGGTSVFRVEVAEFATAAEAAEASKILADEGFVNVDVVQENSQHVLMLGTFNRKADADALLTQVSEAGFALASVVNRDRLRNTNAAAPTAADLSGLSASEQEQTRNVLAMAEKVESGEASAAELTQLREMIQRLPENQKAIVERQESSRSATRGNMQQIFTLYRDFERSMANRDFASAERTLAEVRQIDPNDIYLASRMQALERARSGAGASTSAAAPAPAASKAADPAQVQQLLNEGRALEAESKPAEAMQKYRQALAMDPTNAEARGKVASLDNRAEPTPADEAGGLAAFTENKPLMYGAAGALALIIISLLWLKLRGGKADVRTSTPADGLSSGPDFIDPLAPSGGYNASPTPTPLGSTSLPTGADPSFDGGSATAATAGFAGAGMADFALMDEGVEEEEPVNKTPTPAPRPPAEENDMVSFEEFESTPNVAVATPAAVAPALSDDDVSLNIDDETVNPPAVAPATAPEPTPAKGSSSMDADLEALLKGTFGGGSTETVDVPENLEPALAAAGAAAASASSAPERLVFQQTFDDESEGASPAEWRGEYDYSTLTVASLNEADHGQCLKFDKPEGVGSATYHLSFPPAKNHVLVEFDVRCDEKNKFLLGIYLEKDEDFKQSVHTIVHQLDPNGPASLRVQGQAVPYQMETWRRMRYEIDLVDGILNAFIDNEQVVKDSRLAVTPDYFNTLSIRDNLATTGTLYLDNIRISEA